VILERGVDLDRLPKQVSDPACRLAKEEAAVSAGRAGADAAALDDDDALAALGQKARGGAAGDSGADDDDVRVQVVRDSCVRPRRLRRSSAATAAPTAPSAARIFDLRVRPVVFDLSARLAIGLATV
jgi:hypothetical protein